MKDTAYAFVFIDRAYQLLYNLYHFFYQCLCRVQLPYDYLYCFERPYYLIPIPHKKFAYKYLCLKNDTSTIATEETVNEIRIANNRNRTII